eukprot:TRINITY_DN23065_c0_g1_i1.p1 TRINITY_DN23065_c0_g1~~TRINITY_DN23065_c0_g1_i1.p1  ORF type:complete len:881 (-),score=156.47 TRINITY_DN23065_c0_g1_i1:122-2671(-)
MVALAAGSGTHLVVRYSRRGGERAYLRPLRLESRDGLGDVQELSRGLAAAAGCPGAPVRLLALPPLRAPAAALAASSSAACPGGSRPGAALVEVAPAAGQALAGFLEDSCRADAGVFELRAVFARTSGEGFVHVSVAMPGMAACDSLAPLESEGDCAASAGAASAAASAAAAGGSASNSGDATGGDELALVLAAPERPSASSAEGDLVEQFESEGTSTVADLKKQIQRRTKLPTARMLLLLRGRRLHDDLPMARVAAALDAGSASDSAPPLQLHLASGGVYVFLRREGQGHREPSGGSTLRLSLPPCVLGTRVRTMPFSASQLLGDLRWSVQAASGLPLAGMKLSLTAPVATAFKREDDLQTLESLGFVDDCALNVEYELTDASVLEDCFDVPLDAPAAGDPEVLYAKAASALNLPHASRLTLFAGNSAISRTADLSSAPLADGVVLSAYVAWSLQLSFSVFARKRLDTGTPALTAENAERTAECSSALPASIGCLSSDSINEIRERVTASLIAADYADVASQLNSSKVFAVDRSTWADGSSQSFTLAGLARVLGHFSPCSETARLSRLGLADGEGHLVFVPDPLLHVEVAVHVGGERRGTRNLRVPSTTRLSKLAKRLEHNLIQTPLAECPAIEHSQCRWAINSAAESKVEAGSKGEKDASSSGTSASRTASPGVSPVAAPAKKRRRSFGWGGGDAASEKSKPSAENEIAESEFVGDLHALHPVGPNERPSHFLCPISYDVMQDPVVVVGSGNTYDRKSIDKHFQQRHTDPLSNVDLRRAADRRLVPNNTLRSQIDETERSVIDLRLIAYLGEQKSSLGDASVGAYLGWAASLLRGGGGGGGAAASSS